MPFALPLSATRLRDARIRGIVQKLSIVIIGVVCFAGAVRAQSAARKPRVALIGGYRYLRVDYVNEGFIYRTSLSGITLGARFKL
jgi:hypothetical protein